MTDVGWQQRDTEAEDAEDDATSAGGTRSAAERAGCAGRVGLAGAQLRVEQK